MPLIMSTSLSAGEASSRPRVGIIPFANYTGGNEAADTLLPIVDRYLATLPFDFIPADTLRSVMRSQRLRMTGATNSLAATQLRQILGVDFLLTGSIDRFRSQPNPEVGLSLRLYDCANQRLVWARGAAASGDDYAGLFGVGRVTSMAVLADRVISDALEQLADVSRGNIHRNNPPDTSSRRVAIIALDNVTDQQHVGDICTSMLLSELWQRGYEVIEPGEITRIMAELRSSPRGQVTADEIALLRQRLQVDWIVTGSAHRSSSMSTGSAETVPYIEVGLRLIDAISGRVMAATSKMHSGDDAEGLFGAGRCYSLGRLNQKCLADGWKQLLKMSQKRSALAAHSAIDGGSQSASR
jgi:TolB-like protein